MYSPQLFDAIYIFLLNLLFDVNFFIAYLYMFSYMFVLCSYVIIWWNSSIIDWFQTINKVLSNISIIFTIAKIADQMFNYEMSNSFFFEVICRRKISSKNCLEFFSSKRKLWSFRVFLAFLDFLKNDFPYSLVCYLDHYWFSGYFIARQYLKWAQ